MIGDHSKRTDPQDESPFVSVIIPCRNEQACIAACLDSVVASEYPKDRLEVYVVDGMSDDDTRLIVQEYSQRYPFIRLLDNPKRITPAALNIGVLNARGEVIVRLDAHSSYPPDYFSELIRYLYAYDADNVGGVLKTVPRSDGLLGRAVAVAFLHPFGAGVASYKTGVSQPRWVDTVPFGCYRREVFDRVGLFDEDAFRSEDRDFNLRLRRAGGRILLVPDIVCTYYARSGLWEMFKHSISNGFWTMNPLRFGQPAMTWRHFVPLVFLLSLTVSAALAPFISLFRWLLISVVGMYALASLVASLHAAYRQRDARLVAILPVVFAFLHLGYGLGSLYGIVRVLLSPRFWRSGLWRLIGSFACLGG